MKTIDYFGNRTNLKSSTSKKDLFNIIIKGIAIVIVLFMITTCKKEDELDLFRREKPPIITATQVEDGIKISWTEVRGANAYEVQRRESDFLPPDYLFQQITVFLPVSGNSLVDEAPINGTNYYRVCAMKRVDNPSYYYEYGEYSNVVSINYTVFDGDIE